MTRVLLLGVAAVVLSGCGGSAVPTEPPRPAPSPPETRALARYLDAMRAQYVRFGRLSQDVADTLRRVNDRRPDTSWPRAARRLRTTAAGFRSVASRIAAIEAPAPLARAHFRLAEGVGLFAEYVDGVRSALELRIPSALARAATGDIGPSLTARRAWGESVTRYAKRLGSSVPTWVSPGPAA